MQMHAQDWLKINVKTQFSTRVLRKVTVPLSSAHILVNPDKESNKDL